jgi:hypothetical protein
VVASDVVTLVRGGLVLPAAWFSLEGGGAVAYGIRWGARNLVTVRSDRPFAFSGETVSSEPTTAASGLFVRGDAILYFVGSDTLRRAVLRDGELDGSSPVELHGATAGVIPNWVQAAPLADGRVLLGFVEPQTLVRVGVNDGTGTTFDLRALPIDEPSTNGLLAHVGTTGGGAWVVGYQVADASLQFHAGVVVSTDEGATWRPPIALGPATSDAFPIARPTGGADIYYTIASSGETRIFRRALHDDGSTGPEQAVTDEQVGPVQKPQPRRLVDGRVVMMFTLDHGQGVGDLVATVLDGDAPW